MTPASTTQVTRALLQDTGCAIPAFALNAFLLLPMFGDFTLHIGQGISLFALLLFGFRTALIAALAAGLGLWWSIGDATMPMLLALETSVVAGLVARGLPLVPAAVAFWVLLGLPLNYALAMVWQNLSNEVLNVSVIKQGINGLLNAALAAGGFQLLVESLFKGTLQGRRRQSLPRQAFAISVTLVVLPALMIALVIVNRALDGFGQEVELRLERQAQDYALLTEIHLNRHAAAVRLLVEGNAGTPDAELNDDLDRVQRAYPGFLTMVVADADANVVYGTPREFYERFADTALADRKVEDRDWFREARDSGAPYLSGGFVGRGFGSDPIVAVSAPLFDRTGAFSGVIEGSLSLPRFAHLQAVANGRDFMLIVDGTARRIHASEALGIAPLEAVQVTPAVNQRLVNIKQIELGNRRYFVADASTSQGWTVYALTRTQVLAQTIEQFVISFGLALVMLIALGGWIARAFASSITRPLATLSRQILDPDAVRIELPKDQRRSPEIVRVSETLDQARQLSLRFQDELEKEVAAKTVELRDLNRKLGQLAIGDPLTGLLNRRGFWIKAGGVLDVVRRESLEVVVAMIDIDHFKSVNDEFGHAAGDECLRRIAEQLRATFRRRGDLVARVGGEEFAVLSVIDPPDQRYTCFEQLLGDVEGLVVHHEGRELRMTVSIGAVASSPPAETELDELIKASDRALYASKNAGRNRLTTVELASSEQIESDQGSSE